MPFTLLFNRDVIQDIWIPAVFTLILLFCLFQLGMSVYQGQLQQSSHPQKLHAISAFAS